MIKGFNALKSSRVSIDNIPKIKIRIIYGYKPISLNLIDSSSVLFDYVLLNNPKSRPDHVNL